MRTFPHWRLVGQFMLWARQEVRAGRVTYERTKLDDAEFDHRWTRGRASVVITHQASYETVELIARGHSDETDWRSVQMRARSALKLLRVLAALDLIDEDGELEVGGE